MAKSEKDDVLVSMPSYCMLNIYHLNDYMGSIIMQYFCFNCDYKMFILDVHYD